MGQFRIADFYLDLTAIEALETESQKGLIHQYYSELLHGQAGPGATTSLSQTLIRGGFLKSIVEQDRDEKIGMVLS